MTRVTAVENWYYIELRSGTDCADFRTVRGRENARRLARRTWRMRLGVVVITGHRGFSETWAPVRVVRTRRQAHA